MRQSTIRHLDVGARHCPCPIVRQNAVQPEGGDSAPPLHSPHRALRIALRILITVIALCGPAAFALERFPPPDFTTDYIQPETTTPPPRLAAMEYVDVAVLAAALFIAAYIVLKRRSRRGVVYLTLGAIAYFGFYRQGCVCPIGAVQNVTLAIVDTSYAIPITVLAFFLLPLVIALFFGRVFCGGVCPLGALQDVVLIKHVRVPMWLQHGLSVIPWLFLGTAALLVVMGGAFVICMFDPFIAIFRLSGFTYMLLLGGIFIIASTRIGRPYCRFFCPYSVLLKLAARVSKFRVSISPDTCIKCRLCEDSCPFGAIRPPALPVDAASRPAGKRRLATLILLLPLVAAGAGLIGGQTGTWLANGHSTVQLAQILWLNEQGMLPEPEPDEFIAFEKAGTPAETVFAESLQITSRYRSRGMIFGAFFGLVIMMKLIALSVRRHREGYEADPAECLACGRCYEYCPREHARLKRLASEA